MILYQKRKYHDTSICTYSIVIDIPAKKAEIVALGGAFKDQMLSQSRAVGVFPAGVPGGWPRREGAGQTLLTLGVPDTCPYQQVITRY